MDDLAGKITQMLSDPDTMEQIKGLAGMLGQDGGQNTGGEEGSNLPVPAAKSADPGKGGGLDTSALAGLLSGLGGEGKGGAPDLSTLSGLLGGLGGKGGGSSKGGAADLLSGMSGDTMQTVMRIMPMLSEINKEDDSTRLLNALRPFLGPERRKKLDESAKMLHMMKLLPLLKGLQL